MVPLGPPAISITIDALWTKISQQEASHKPDLQVSIYLIQPCSNLSLRDHGYRLAMLDISTIWNRPRRIAHAESPTPNRPRRIAQVESPTPTAHADRRPPAARLVLARHRQANAVTNLHRIGPPQCYCSDFIARALISLLGPSKSVGA